ncbi:MAG: hypothetical protein KGJ24_06735 [Burkholderiales bacterium]|nr:hypothetical protein [Burkholderiales bacterium]MDE2565055.1 hypothetical protein [Burkholderiales bacterium]
MSETRADAPLPSAATLLQLLDALAWPLIVLRAGAELLHANRAGHLALHEALALHLGPDRRVQPTAADVHPAFLQALAEVAAGGPRRALRLGATAGACTVHLVPLGPAGGTGPVLLALPAPGSRAEVGAFAERHRLTPAETRVLERLVHGDSSTRAAAVLGSSPATVRSQIVALRRKSGHRDLGALLRDLAGLPSPAPGAGRAPPPGPRPR